MTSARFLAASISGAENNLLTSTELVLVAGLFVLLLVHEVLRIYRDDIADRRMKDLRVVIGPLFQVFCLILYVRTAGLLR